MSYLGIGLCLVAGRDGGGAGTDDPNGTLLDILFQCRHGWLREAGLTETLLLH